MKAVILMGNMGAGKTPIATKMAKIGWGRLAIDDFREERSDENQARSQLLEAIAGASKKFVYETTCANQIYPASIRAIEALEIPIIRILLKVSESNSRQRVEERFQANWFGLPHDKSFAYIQEKLMFEPYDYVFDTDQLSAEEIFREILKIV